MYHTTNTIEICKDDMFTSSENYLLHFFYTRYILIIIIFFRRRRVDWSRFRFPVTTLKSPLVERTIKLHVLTAILANRLALFAMRLRMQFRIVRCVQTVGLFQWTLSKGVRIKNIFRGIKFDWKWRDSIGCTAVATMNNDSLIANIFCRNQPVCVDKS